MFLKGVASRAMPPPVGGGMSLFWDGVGAGEQLEWASGVGGMALA